MEFFLFCDKFLCEKRYSTLIKYRIGLLKRNKRYIEQYIIEVIKKYKQNKQKSDIIVNKQN